jgi:prepilin-type processing-associated H-X9-DG protein
MSDQPPSTSPSTPRTPTPQPPEPTTPLRMGMAITALVFGIVGTFTCAVLGLLAIILGIVALKRTTREPQRYGGRGMAVAGIATGSAGLLVNIIWLALLTPILLPLFSQPSEESKRLICAANMKGIGVTMMIYTAEHPGQGLPTLQELVDLEYITPKHLVCPSTDDQPGDCSYILVPNAQMRLDGGDKTVVLYEPLENHAGEGGNFLFADGHVTFERKQNYEKLVKTIQRGGP